MIVYCATNTVNGKQYVGQTIKTLAIRRSQHFYRARKNIRTNVLSNAIRKYGENSFTWKILKVCENVEELNIVEQKYITKLKTFAPNGYNLTAGGLSYEVSEHTKKKMKNATIKYFANSENRKKMSIAMMNNKNNLGKKRSKETREKQSKSMLGKNLGKVASKETKRKMSEARKGEKNYNYGKVASVETREKQSQAKIGNKNMLGKTLSEETKKKISDSLKAYWKNKGYGY